MNRFEGKVALITGTASGIGRATAQRLAAEGAKVVCTDVQLDGLEETVRDITSQGRAAVSQVCDVSDKDAVCAAVGRTIDQYGKLDVRCNVAGILETSHTHEVYSRSMGTAPFG
ncbi:MAG: SDR family NAD(P)-dependent oxidoreductase [Chloroflexi bacterium]|nr:SDR family NAD(P)-dependent oxidoreductase [Chloroflexota bacterium]